MLGWVAVTVSEANGAGDGKSRGSGGSGGVQLQSHSGMSIHHARLGDPASDLKVANIVILNNTGLPDSDIYFNLINTATIKDDSGAVCPPNGDWNNLFQSYGGSVNDHTLATPIVLNPVTPVAGTLSYSYENADGTGFSYATLESMRGSVLSNASSTLNPPTSSSLYWANATYSDLVPHNPDGSIKGTFPTISMGLFGACDKTVLKPYAGRIVISAKEFYTGDLYNGKSPPYLLIEGSIFPTDNSTATSAHKYPPKASNFDLSFVEQISIAAKIELWSMDSDGGFTKKDNGWLAGTSVTTVPTTMDSFAQSVGKSQNVKYVAADGKNYDLYYAFTKDMSSYTSPLTTFVSPYKAFLADLINKTTASLSPAATPHPVVKVAGVNIQIGTLPIVFETLEFGDCNYGNQLGYNFATYFVDMSLPASSTNWTKILNWYKTDSTTAVDVTPSDPTQYFSTANSNDLTKNHYMLMLGTFLPESGGGISPFPLCCNPGNGGGPLSIQLNSNTITICDALDAGQCNNTNIQTLGLGGTPGQNHIDGIFGNTNTLNGPLGINFYVTDAACILSEFDLSVGKTSVGPGTLDVDLVNVNGITSTNLVRVSITLPVTTPNEGSASAVMLPSTCIPPPSCCNVDLYDTGFNPTSGWPLQINWKDGTCIYNGTTLSTTASLWNGSNWVPTTHSDPEYIKACILNNNTSTTPATSYKLNIQGVNLTVALTSGAPTSTIGSPIVPGTGVGSTDFYTNGNASNNWISKHNNAFLLNQITLAPAKNATSYLHLLAVSEADLLLSSGLAGNNPKYRFLRWNTSKTPPAWEEAFGSGDAGGWPKNTTTGDSGLCAPPTIPPTTPPTSYITVGPPQSGLLPPATTQNLLNNISGRVEGDICAAFTYGIVNSTKTGNDFPNQWPTTNPFPPKNTAIGALTTQEYFQLIGSLKANDGTLPVGKNLTDTTLFTTYDPYNSLGVNEAQSSGYFCGFSDRFSSFGGIFTPNPTFLMDSTTPPLQSQLLLGNVPGADQTSNTYNNTVIVITLHPIHIPTAWDTIDSDLDNDFDTDSTDLSLMLLAMSVYPPAPETGSEDLNKDGVLDNTDLGLVFLHFGD